ncbi:hypothetical protein [Brevundimonas mediterranea]|uniref:Uncharacterized protein n=1 Tax=Brevundimonas mediterranea TaxID=74329 RepID=A0A7W6A2Z1_9CAUL|nr:hypothetical protein [Brevundimonas mediterranea]MBB3870742.1 hypothetical protein [Brevundimonas mediterranea]
MWRLFRPLRYFALRNREKTALDFMGTAIIATILIVPFLLVPDASFFRAGGFLDRLIGLMSALTGFFVAALVAAATFAHPDLDREMGSGAVEMKINDGEETRWQRLTRREWACAIFGYLSFATFIFSVMAAIAVPVATSNPEVPWWLPDQTVLKLSHWFYEIRYTLMLLFLIPLGHIMTVTGIGIYYLMDRLHYKKPVIVHKSDAA